jgi:hypothetical protein
MTVLFLMVDLALFFNQYVNPIAIDDIHWKYYIVFVSITLFRFRARADRAPSARGLLLSLQLSGDITLRRETHLWKRSLSILTVMTRWLEVPPAFLWMMSNRR